MTVDHIAAPGKRAIYSIAVNSENTRLAIGQTSGAKDSPTLSLVDLKSGKVLQIIERTVGSTGAVYQVVFEPDTNNLMYAFESQDGLQLKVYDTSQKIGFILADLSEIPRGLTFDAKGENLIVAGKKIGWWRKQVRQANVLDKVPAKSPATISPNGKLVAIGGAEKDQVVLYDLSKREVVKKFEFPYKEIGWVVFSSTSKLLAAVDYYGRGLFVWDVSSGKRYLPDTFHDDMPYVCRMCFDSKGKYFAVGLATSYVVVYDVKKGTEVFGDRLHKSRVEDVSFTSDSKLLLSAGEDHQVYIRKFK